jgi:hypothetical protein
MSRRLGLLLSVSIATLSTHAWGQSDRELATRQELITQAKGMSAAGKHEEALSLAKRASAIKMSTSLRMFIAQEEAAAGHIAEAYGNSRQCVAEADADAQLHDGARILATCQALEDSLSKRVGRVVIMLPSPLPPNLHVQVAGEDVNVALLGTPYVVSPGTVTVAVTATGFVPYKSEVAVREGESADVNVHLEADTSGPCPELQERVGPACLPICAGGKARNPPDAGGCCWPGQTWDGTRAACTGTRQCPLGFVNQGEECVARPLPPAPPQVPLTVPPPAPSRLGPILLAGGGALVALVATAIWLDGNSQYSTLKSECEGPGGCNVPTYNSGASSIRLDDGLGVGGWITGGALVASGAIWFLVTRQKETATSASARARLFVNPATRAVGWEGRF